MLRIRQPLIILVIFAVAGLACGWLWHQLWAPAPTGVGYQGRMLFPDDVVFRATGLYLLIAISAGLVLGAVLTYLLERDEVATLVAVVCGALLAGVLMALLGAALGPDSAHAAAEQFSKKPGEITGDLSVEPLALWTCFPGSAVVSALFVLVTFTRRTHPEPTADDGRRNADDLETESTDMR